MNMILRYKKDIRDQFFGFTYTEVKEMLAYYGAADKEAELKDWYDEYLFGNTEIYNPWSIIFQRAVFRRHIGVILEKMKY